MVAVELNGMVTSTVYPVSTLRHAEDTKPQTVSVDATA